MDDYLVELGNRPASAAMQKDLVALLNAGNGHDEYKEWLTQNEATVAQIALISYLVNDGLVVMTPSGEDAQEAIHFQNDIPATELANTLQKCKEQVKADLQTFEAELHALTLSPDSHTGLEGN